MQPSQFDERVLLESVRNRMRIITILLTLIIPVINCWADSIASNPIVFVTTVPNPADFGTFAATFGNHVPNPNQAFRGGDLWIRYPDGTLKNLTAAAGLGSSGLQGANSIAVRDPSVHWDGTKIIFSMVVGAPTSQYQLTNHKWQLWEVTGLGASDTPVFTKVPNQPSSYNNISPVYDSDDNIIFVSDRPRDDTVLHTYPQRDEYESSVINSGLWKLVPSSGMLTILDHSPSGDFNPIIDSFGRVIFTRWDHLQRDQQNVGASMNAFNYASETSTSATSSAAEVFPEARSVLDPNYRSDINLFTINQFFPWMMNQDGTDLETLNHVGRQEIGLYSERSFNNDSNVQEFYGQYSTGANQHEFQIFLHIKENPNTPGTYFGTNCQEFGTHSGGQLMTITGAPGVNPNNMIVTPITHPDTSAASDSPSANHSGLYREPLPLSNGNLLAVHTSNTRTDSNIGTSTNPLSRYAYRIKLLSKPSTYYTASTPLTSGITKTVSFWDPDKLVSYSGELWELMPVEVKSRTRPNSTTIQLPSIESAIFDTLNISVSELQQYLKDQNLALVVSRNLTTRDKNDRQQPTNLRVTGTSTESIPNSGKIYDISFLQFFQGDLIRGYAGGNTNGRRVLAQPMHSVSDGLNPSNESGLTGAVKIAQDGSMAAFVPARRALSWHMTSPSGESVVKERYWLTFQPGEIRVCASCHGVNQADHLNQPAPTNPPLALAQLLAHWKDLPPPQPTPSPTRTPSDKDYSLTVKGIPSIKAGNKFSLSVSTKLAKTNLYIKAKINSLTCLGSKSLSSKKLSLVGRFPKIKKSNITFMLYRKKSKSQLTKSVLSLPGLNTRKADRGTCRALIKSLK